MIRSYRTPLLAVALVGFIALPPAAMAAQKTAKQCDAEWTANKSQLQAAGTKKKDFIAQCRSEEATAAPTGAAAGEKSAAAPPAKAAPPPSGTARTGAATAAGAGQFATEAQAKSHCPGDTVVWANLDSKIYHYSTSRNYANTKSGTYMCEKDTAAAGIRAPKNEKHP